MALPLIRSGLLALALVAGAATGASGVGGGLERALSEIGQSLRDKPASGDLHIVEIDARSIAAIDRWPWPRRQHAQLIDRLHAAGVGTIAFDVDFSSRSSAEDDRRMAQALERAGGGVVLPTFRQRAGAGRNEWIDLLPFEAAHAHAVLASVSIEPDRDGRVRRAPLGTVTAGTPRPSLSAAIAGRGGMADESFPIDYAVDPQTIPRHSFVDIVQGRFDPAVLRGKAVLVGATAIELGDRYAVPRFGVIPGVVIQALAAETLARAVPVGIGWALPLAAALLLACLVVLARRRWTLAVAGMAGPILLFGGALLLAGSGIEMKLVPGLVALAVATSGATLRRAFHAYQRRRAIHGPSGLPNRLAMLRELASLPAAGVAAVRIGNFEQLAAGLDATHLSALLVRVAERMALVSAGAAICRIEDRSLAWRVAELDEAELHQAFASLRGAMLAPVEVGGRRVDVVLSSGFADLVDGPEQAINNAILAADRARAAGETWHRAVAGEKEGLARDLSLMGELDEAIDRGEVRVLYQPKLDLRTDRIGGVEALVRWHHATRGLLPPDMFIPLAERDDRIARLTLHVLDTTIADLRGWRDAGHSIAGAVNLSAKLLADAGFMTLLTDRVAAGGLDPHLLTIEVTESAAMHDPAGAAEALARLRGLGVRISMDDYGTGQSTLSYLKRLPLDELKIDRSFVQHADRNRGDAVLVRSTVELAHDLGLRVVAEGVEDESCLAFLRSVQCDYAQGYLISRPVVADEIARQLVERHKPMAA